jgi:hypothetical protein
MYKSSPFCSLVSLLRYVKINDINYRFTKDKIVPNKDGTMKFKETECTIKFLDDFSPIIKDFDWYKHLRTIPRKNYYDPKEYDVLKVYKKNDDNKVKKSYSHQISDSDSSDYDSEESESDSESDSSDDQIVYKNPPKPFKYSNF